MIRPASVAKRAGRSNSLKVDDTLQRSRNSSDVERVVELRRVNDEQRKEITALRQQLEAERQKVRDAQREKNLAQRQAKEQLEKEREHLIEVTARRAAADKEVELKGNYEAQLRSRDQELRQVVKFREDELRKQRQQLVRQRDEVVRTVRDETERRIREQLEEQHGHERAKLLAELWAVREQKSQVDQLLEIRTASEQEKVQMIRSMRNEHAQEIDSLVRKSKMEAQRDAQQLRLADRMMQQKEQELAQREYNAKILEMEKDTLADKVSMLKTAESWDKRSSLSKPLRPSDTGGSNHEGLSPPQKKRVDRKDRDDLTALTAKITRMTTTIHSLEEQLAVAKGENVSMRTQLEQQQPTGDARANESKIRQLRQRVADLSRQCKQQQDKIKTVQDELKAVQSVREGSQSDLQVQKRQFQRQRVKDLSEFKEQMASKDDQLQAVREEVQKLKLELANVMNTNKSMTTAASSVQGEAMIEERDRLQTNINLLSKEKVLVERKFALQMKLSMEETAAAISRRDDELETLRQKERQYLQQLEEASKDSIQRQQLEVQLESQTERCASLVQCVEELTREKDEALSQLQLTEKVAQELQAKSTAMQVQLSQLQEVEEERDLLNRKLQNTQSELETVTAECTILKERISSFEGEDSETVKVQKQLVELTEKLAEAEKRLESQCIQEQAQAVEAHKQQVQLPQDLLEHSLSSSDKVLDLQDQVHSLEEECAEKELQCMALQEQVDKLKTALEHMSNKVDRLSSPGGGLMNGHCEEGSKEEDAEGLAIRVSQPRNFTKLDLPAEKKSTSGDHHLTDEDMQERTLEDEIQAAGYQHGLNDGSGESDTESSFSSGTDEDSEDESEESSMESSTSDREHELKHDRPQQNGELFSADSQEDLLTAGSSGDLPILDVDDDITTGHSPAAASVLKELRKATQQLDEEMKAHEKRKSTGGNISVVMALYDYDPQQFSPNNPEDELNFKTGDYIYVYGLPDEDGFYHGELLNGKKGLVPSNFVEPVVGEGDADIFRQASPSRKKLSIESLDDSKMTPQDTKVPAPQRLVLQRQFDRSVIVQWTPVDLPAEDVLEYKVLANEELKATVTGNYTSAMVDGLNLKKHSYWISVRTVTVDGESADPDELLFVGKQPELPVQPVQSVKITAGAAKGSLLVSWKLPSSEDNMKWHQYLRVSVTRSPSERDKQESSSAEVLVNGQVCSATLLPTTTSCEIPAVTVQEWAEDATLVVTVQSESVTNYKVTSQQTVFTQAAILQQTMSHSSHLVDDNSDHDDSDSDQLEIFPSPDREANGHAKKGSRPGSKQANAEVERPPDHTGEIRLMAALYNYDPLLQSPNEDGCDTELAFKEGDILQIFGDEDEAGFLQGELNGQRGLVPSNMVQDIECDEETKLKILEKIRLPEQSSTTVDEVEQSSLLNVVAGSGSSSTLSSSDDDRNEITRRRSQENHDEAEYDDEAKPPRKHARALYSYNPDESSPNVDTEAELPFTAGVILSVFGEPDEDGFYQGELNGLRGLVPSNYIEMVPSEDIIVMKDGTLGIYQEGMTREVGIDVDFNESHNEPPRTRRLSQESTSSTKKKGLVSRSRRFVKKTFSRHSKKSSSSLT